MSKISIITLSLGLLLTACTNSNTLQQSANELQLENAKSIHLPDGSIYVGELSNNLPNGYGKLTYPNGNRYVGEFNNGTPNGNGELITAEGRYRGTIVNGLPNGFGITKNNDGSLYEGEHKEGQFDGRGKLTLSDGSYFIGLFRNSKVSTGTMHFANAPENPLLIK